MSITAQLKKNRSAQTEYLTKKLTDQNKKGFQKQEGFWSPTVDKSGNGWAIIRFLPAGNGEIDPYVSIMSYSFRGPTGQWYIENARTTLGKEEPDPCAEYVYRLWREGEKEEVKKFPRRQNYIANVLVINDSGNPENNGKVFLYKFGKQIADKINEAYIPKIPSDPSLKVFDIWDGANFNVIVGRKDKFQTYESSKFVNPSPLAKSDEAMDAILEKCKPLQELISPDKFKPYDVLKKRFDMVIGVDSVRTAPVPRTEAPVSSKSVPEKSHSTEVESEEDLAKLLEEFDKD